MTRQRLAVLADLLADVVAVVAFVLIGRSSHHEDEALTGFLRTLWPFATGLVVGWLVVGWLVRQRRLEAVRWPAGLLVGSSAAVVGLLLRAVSGQGVAVSFLVVAVVVLTALTTGWRVVWQVVQRVVRRGFSARHVADLP